jgi:transcriptional regulator GlxA family with amidase domain
MYFLNNMKTTTETAGQYHLQLRIGRAKDLLTGTALPVQQIAIQLGFDSPFYFSRIFKKKTGLAPQEWRTLTAPSSLNEKNSATQFKNRPV